MNVVNPVSAGIRITPSAQHHARCHLNSQWLAAEPHSAASSTLSSGSGRYLSISLVGAALCATAKWADQCRIWVNRVGWAVLACRLRPRLRTYRCEAANRRFGPTTEVTIASWICRLKADRLSSHRGLQCAGIFALKKATTAGLNSRWNAVRSNPSGSWQISGTLAARAGEHGARNAKWPAFGTT
jgi:hypothetical protein